MGFLARLFGRGRAVQPAAKPEVVEVPKKPAPEKSAPKKPAPEKAAGLVESPVNEVDPEAGFGFDPESTIFMSPHISMQAQQALRKLRELTRQNVTHYRWVCTPDCGEPCKLAAAEGPYSVEDGLSGIAPVPGVGRHKTCTCDIEAVRD